jgi:hypothetical protein
VTYIISRGVFCPVNLLYPALRSETCPIGVKFICFMILVQSAHYILQMWGILKKKMREHREMRAKGVEYNWFSVAEGIEKLSFVKTEEKQKIF